VQEIPDYSAIERKKFEIDGTSPGPDCRAINFYE
jgi:hypothetical protein